MRIILCRVSKYLAALICLVLTGCAGYRLGPTNGAIAGAKTIQVNPVVNQTMQPRLGEPLAHALRKMLQQDGTYKLQTSGEADVMVTATVIDYKRSELSYQPNDLVTVRDYTIYMTAQIKVVERSSGKVLVDKAVTGKTTAIVKQDFSSMEKQIAPLLAEDLARKATYLIVDGGW